MGVIAEAIGDDVGISRIANERMPFTPGTEIPVNYYLTREARRQL